MNTTNSAIYPSPPQRSSYGPVKKAISYHNQPHEHWLGIALSLSVVQHIWKNVETFLILVLQLNLKMNIY